MSPEKGNKGSNVILFPGIEAPKEEQIDDDSVVEDPSDFLRESIIMDIRPCIEMMISDGVITQNDLAWDQDTGRVFVREHKSGELIDVVDFAERHYLYPSLKIIS